MQPIRFQGFLGFVGHMSRLLIRTSLRHIYRSDVTSLQMHPTWPTTPELRLNHFFMMTSFKFPHKSIQSQLFQTSKNLPLSDCSDPLLLLANVSSVVLQVWVFPLNLLPSQPNDGWMNRVYHIFFSTFFVKDIEKFLILEFIEPKRSFASLTE